MTRLLVLSQASVNRPHRRVYDLIAREPGWDVHIVAPERLPVGDFAKLCDPPDDDARYVLHPLPLAAPSSGRLQFFRGLTSLAFRLRPDVVFAEHDPGSVQVLHGWLAVRWSAGAVVGYTVENLVESRWRNATVAARAGRWNRVARDLFVGALDFAGASAAAGLACMNDDAVRIYRHHRSWRKPLALVPLGTDLDRFKPLSAEQRRKLRDRYGVRHRFAVGFFGRLVKEKGVELLLEALSNIDGDWVLLMDAFRNFQPGAYVERLLRKAADLGVADRLLTFDVGHEQVPEVMNCCDVIVLPSLTTPTFKEQFGRVLPEAMACGVPVVCSDSGNLPAVVGEAGWVVPEGDVCALAAAVRSVRDDDPLRRARIAAGLDRARHQLSVGAQKQALLRLFQEATAG